MAIFPVQYSERLPPAVGPNVPINLDTRTGAGAVAGAMGGFGEAMTQAIAKIQLADDAMEESLLVKRGMETWNAGFQVARSSQDPEAQKTAFDQTFKDMSAIGSKRKRVNDAYIRWLNGATPQYQIHAANLMNETKINRAVDKYKISSQFYLENNNEFEFYQLQDMAEGTGIITPEMAKFNKDNYAVNMRLAKAENQAGKNNFGEVQKMFDELDKMSLSNDQIAAKDKLENYIKRKQSNLIDINFQEYWADLRKGSLDELQAKIDTSGIPVTGDGGKSWWTNLIKARRKEIEGGEDVTNNPIAESRLEQQIGDVWRGTITPNELRMRIATVRDLGTDISGKKVKIDDDAVARLEDKIAKEIKSNQESAISELRRRLTEGIVSVQSDEGFKELIQMYRTNKLDLQADKAENQRADEFWWVNQGIESLYDEFAKNKDLSGKDLRGSMERIYREFRDSGKSDIQKKYKTGLGELSAKPKELLSPKSKSEYDSIPSGTFYIAPDGTKRIKQ